MTDKKTEESIAQEIERLQAKLDHATREIETYKDLTDQLRVEKQSLQNTVDAIADGIWTWDLVANELHFSDRYYQMLGYEPGAFPASEESWRVLMHPEDREVAIQVAPRFFAEKPSQYENEFRMLAKDGTYRWIRSVASVVEYSEDGIPVFLIGSHEDITVAKLAEQRLLLAATAGSDLIYEWDVLTDALHWFGGIDEALGYEPDQFPRTIEAWVGRIHPDDQERLQDAVERHRTSLNMIYEEYRIQHKNGNWLYWVDKALPVLDHNRKPIKWIGACVDATDQRVAEEALKNSQYLLNEASQIARLGSYSLDIKTGYWTSSESLNEIFGIGEDYYTDVEGWLALIHPDDRAKMDEYFSQYILTQHEDFNQEYRIVRHDNQEVRWVHGLGKLEHDWVGNPILLIGTIQDITERRELEDLMLQYARQQEIIAKLGQFALTNQSLEDIFKEAVQLVSVTLRVEYTKILQLDPETEELLLVAGVGWQKGLVGDAIVNAGDNSQAGYTLASESPVVVEDLTQESRFNGPALLIEHGIVSGMSVVIGDTEKPFGIFGAHTRFRRSFSSNDVFFLQSVANILADAIKNRSVEESLRSSEERYRALFEHAGDAISLVDEEDKILDVNPSFSLLMGYSEEELLQMSIQDLQSPEYRVTEGNVVKKEYARYGSSPFEVVNKARDGSDIPLEIRLSKIQGSQGDMYFSIYRDITDRKLIDQERQKSYDMLTSIMGSINAHIYVADINTFEILYMNEHMQKDFGEDYTGEFCYQVFRNEQAPCSHCNNNSLIDEDGNPTEVQVWESMNPVTGKWYSNHDRALRWHDGRMVRIQIATDITERKQAEKRISELNTLRDNLFTQGTLHQKMQWVTDQMVESFEADFCRIWIIQPGDLCDQNCIHASVDDGPHVCRYRNLCLHLVASSGRYTHIDGEVHRRVPFGCYKIGRVASGENTKFLTNDVINDPQVHDRQWARELDLVSFVGYRLVSTEGEVLGVMALFSRQPISDREDELLESVSGTISQVIQAEKAEVALRENEIKYRGLFNNSPSSLWEQDFSAVKRCIDEYRQQDITDWRFFFESNPEIVKECLGLIRNITINQASLKLYGAHSEAELLTNLEKLIPDEALPRFVDELIWIAEGKTEFEIENINRTLLDEIIDVRIQWSAMPGYESTLERVLVSIENITAQKEAEKKLKRRADEMALLHAITLDLTSLAELQPMLTSIVARATDLLNASSGGLYLCDETKRQTRCIVSYQTEKDFTGTVLKYGEGAAGTVAETGQPLIIDDYRLWDSRAEVYAEEKSFQAVLSVPIIWQDHVNGVLHVLRTVKDDKFTEQDLDLLTTVANHTAIAIENTRLMQQIQRHADDLEESVNERTSELQMLVNAMAGREVRMADLKKVIKRLREQLQDAGMTPVADDPLNEP